MADLNQAKGSKPALLTSASPAAVAARRLVEQRIGAVARLVKRTERSTDPEAIHQLRVATRRASAAVEAFALWMEPGPRDRLQRRLKRIRRAAGRVRDCDVQLSSLDQIDQAAGEARKELLRRLVRWTRQQREEALARFSSTLERRSFRLRRLARQALEGAEPPADLGGRTYLDAAAPVMDAVRSEVRAAAARDLSDLAGLHALRLALKHLRYAAELFRPCLSERFQTTVHPAIGRAQDVLGAVNDAGEMVAHLERLAHRAGSRPELAAEIRALGARYAAVRDRRHREALSWWEGFTQGGALDGFEAILREPPRPAHPPVPSSGSPARATLLASGADFPATLFPSRLGAIDVGSNSIRLIVAEAAPDGTYRVLDDEKEVVRLGQGLANSGRLTRSAMDRAAGAIARMREIAEGYGVAHLRVIGTSAARDARNGADLVEIVRRGAGVEIEIISAEEEARLAFLSASRAFDIQAQPVAIVDLGGGSTEVVLSAAGIVEEVFTLKIGAVRLADRFGGAEQAAGPRYERMQRFIREALRQRIGRPPFAPQLLIGTGGTFAAAAHMHRAMSRSPGAAAVQGHELRRADILHMLDRLRKLPLRAREKFPGLAPDRADIIVPGLAIIDGLLRHMKVNRVLVHDRGIRDGLLLTMIREHLPGVRPAAPARPDALASVRRFARACRYEEAHAEHVARLALSIFDQLLAARPRLLAHADAPEARTILEASAVLHDAGYLINYARHHKHSYHLIMHADLDGLTARQVELVANIARYHRRAEPSLRHANFAKLAREDRRLVEVLAAILRIADGLDRAHTQGVRSVEVRVGGRTARFVVDAEGPAAAELWGAQRKDGLFRGAIGLNPRIEARGADATV
jgi:exopolyphosphatase/guanosine-5'-triphosphate,3'-diphosphate pyrophosphatase